MTTSDGVHIVECWRAALDGNTAVAAPTGLPFRSLQAPAYDAMRARRRLSVTYSKWPS